mmetsp:Transcript_38616/g.93570  ORF Transcript_38616/g.93570 Transcript_38616/m.93570 type:complete len:542 (-) Transcript_38616:279-1904(-)
MEKEFLSILQKHGDKTMTALATNMVNNDDTEVKVIPQLYQTIRGEKNDVKRTIYNQALTYWILNLKNQTDPTKPLKATTYHTKIRQIDAILRRHGCQFQYKEMTGASEFMGVYNNLLRKHLDKDESYADPSAPAFDEERDNKIDNLMSSKKYDVYHDPTALTMIVFTEMGRYLGYRGGEELVSEKWRNLKFLEWSTGPKAGLQYVRVHINGGFDKTNRFGKGTTRPRDTYHLVSEDKNDQYCLFYLLRQLRKWSHPEQERLLCYPLPNHAGEAYKYQKGRPIGKNKLLEWTKKVAEDAGIIDWQKYTTHNNRHHCVTAVQNTNVPEAEQLLHTRHASKRSQRPYTHATTKGQVSLHESLQKNESIQQAKPAAVATTKPTATPSSTPTIKKPPPAAPTNRPSSASSITRSQYERTREELAKATRKNDRYKRQRDKANSELEDADEEIKRLKDENRRLRKERNDERDRSRYLDQQLHQYHRQQYHHPPPPPPPQWYDYNYSYPQGPTMGPPQQQQQHPRSYSPTPTYNNQQQPQGSNQNSHGG